MVMDIGKILNTFYTSANDTDKQIIKGYLESKVETDESYKELYLVIKDLV